MSGMMKKLMSTMRNGTFRTLWKKEAEKIRISSNRAKAEHEQQQSNKQQQQQINSSSSKPSPRK
jgi:hypothetical protein